MIGLISAGELRAGLPAERAGSYETAKGITVSDEQSMSMPEQPQEEPMSMGQPEHDPMSMGEPDQESMSMGQPDEDPM